MVAGKTNLLEVTAGAHFQLELVFVEGTWFDSRSKGAHIHALFFP
jgi:hypothetical protein